MFFNYLNPSVQMLESTDIYFRFKAGLFSEDYLVFNKKDLLRTGSKILKRWFLINEEEFQKFDDYSYEFSENWTAEVTVSDIPKINVKGSDKEILLIFLSSFFLQESSFVPSSFYVDNEDRLQRIFKYVDCKTESLDHTLEYFFWVGLCLLATDARSFGGIHPIKVKAQRERKFRRPKFQQFIRGYRDKGTLPSECSQNAKVVNKEFNEILSPIRIHILSRGIKEVQLTKDYTFKSISFREQFPPLDCEIEYQYFLELMELIQKVALDATIPFNQIVREIREILIT